MDIQQLLPFIVFRFRLIQELLPTLTHLRLVILVTISLPHTLLRVISSVHLSRDLLHYHEIIEEIDPLLR